MMEETRSRGSRIPLYAIVALVLLLVISFFWKGCAVARAEKGVEAVRAELAEQQEELEQRLREQADARVEETLRLVAIPLGWAVRAEAIRDDFEQIEEYANQLLKEPRVRRVVFVDPEGVIRTSTDRKLVGRPVEEFFRDVAGTDKIVVRRETDGGYTLAVPILGYNERLGSLVLALDGA